jgi:hypothetical protein
VVNPWKPSFIDDYDYFPRFFSPLVFHIYVFLPKGSTIRYPLVWLGIMIVFFWHADMPISQPLVGGDYGRLQALYVIIVFSNRMQSYAILNHPSLYPLLTHADTEGSQINPLFSTKTIRTPGCEFSFQQICNTRRTIHCRGVSCDIIHAAGQLFSGNPPFIVAQEMECGHDVQNCLEPPEAFLHWFMHVYVGGIPRIVIIWYLPSGYLT